MKRIKSATAEVWRLRARHNRALIEHTQDRVTRDKLGRLADEYDALARGADGAAPTVGVDTAARGLKP
jgi:hypothetical protein